MSMKIIPKPKVDAEQIARWISHLNTYVDNLLWLQADMIRCGKRADTIINDRIAKAVELLKEESTAMTGGLLNMRSNVQ